MTSHVLTRPCALTIVSFRLFGEFRLVNVFFSFGHGEDCVVVISAQLLVRRRANVDGLSSDNSTRVNTHRKSDTFREFRLRPTREKPLAGRLRRTTITRVRYHSAATLSTMNERTIIKKYYYA